MKMLMNKIYLDLVLHSSGFMCNKNTGKTLCFECIALPPYMLRCRDKSFTSVKILVSLAVALQVIPCHCVLCLVLKLWTPSGQIRTA